MEEAEKTNSNPEAGTTSEEIAPLQETGEESVYDAMFPGGFGNFEIGF